MPTSEFLQIAHANPLSLSLKAVFEELDVDGDGYITRSELRTAFQRMGHSLSDQDIKAIYKHVDVNNDGKINFHGESWKGWIILVRRHCHRRSLFCSLLLNTGYKRPLQFKFWAALLNYKGKHTFVAVELVRGGTQGVDQHRHRWNHL
ncbi:unnamed protein product [Nippostrongylus brasiliensis]|uniref:EF-hand domain-containing protein n=1 Tax=Nippostrongylus brasiliensis TaxID=27835 RepID=A0A0N4XPA1_NIPBR|nr:unnamed protein product [Nippostrongylus brasiliensis]